MILDNRSKRYNGKFTDKNGACHMIYVKINPRIASMLLAVNLIPTNDVWSFGLGKQK